MHMFYLTGESSRVNTFTYMTIAGIATITTSIVMVFGVDNSVTITGAGQTQYNGSFVVTKVNSLTSFEANLGVQHLHQQQLELFLHYQKVYVK